MPDPQCCCPHPRLLRAQAASRCPDQPASRTSRPLPALAGGPGLPSTCTYPVAPQRYQIPGALGLLVLRNRARLSTLCQEFVASESWRIPCPPPPWAVAAGKGQAAPGSLGRGRRGGASRVTGSANSPQQRVHRSGLPRACQSGRSLFKNRRGIIRIIVRRGAGKEGKGMNLPRQKGLPPSLAGVSPSH